MSIADAQRRNKILVHTRTRTKAPHAHRAPERAFGSPT